MHLFCFHIVVWRCGLTDKISHSLYTSSPLLSLSVWAYSFSASLQELNFSFLLKHWSGFWSIIKLLSLLYLLKIKGIYKIKNINMYAQAHVCRRPEEGIRFCGANIRGSCMLPCVGARNWTLVLCKSIQHVKLENHLSSSNKPFQNWRLGPIISLNKKIQELWLLVIKSQPSGFLSIFPSTLE